MQAHRPANDYFVSPRGLDTNPGTRALPWRTLERIGQACLRPGDRVLLEAGKSFPGSLILGPSRFPIDGMIFIGSDGTEPAEIDAGNDGGILLWDTGGYHFSHLRVRG